MAPKQEIDVTQFNMEVLVTESLISAVMPKRAVLPRCALTEQNVLAEVSIMLISLYPHWIQNIPCRCIPTHNLYCVSDGM